MIYINASESGSGVGLGKSKLLKKISIKKIAKQVSIKNVVKAAKFAAPIAAGFIPVGGGIATKLLNSKAGKVVSKVKSSKLVKKAVDVKKKLTPVKSIIPKKAKKSKRLAKGSKGAEVKKLQESLGVEADGDFGPKTEAALQKATGAKSVSVDQSYSAPPTYSAETQTAPMPAPATTARPASATPAYVAKAEAEEIEPVGELTPVTQTAGFMPAQGTPAGTTPKDNTLLYVGGAVAVGAIAYLATKK
ncbi:hypothetical protein [Flavobacterium sp. ZB4P13]|uniref:peptidoglycan-binding domain-containing protein n=1 Tax=Flavobacterium sp. ZB4P13 TaxID=3401728 RepID=UPI003AAF6F3F